MIAPSARMLLASALCVLLTLPAVAGARPAADRTAKAALAKATATPLATGASVQVRFAKRPQAGTTLRLERGSGNAWNTLVRRRAKARSVTLTWAGGTPGTSVRLRVRVIRRGRTLATPFNGQITILAKSTSTATPTTPAPSAPATEGPWNLITDQRLLPIPAPATYPAVGQTITDPQTGFQVRRFSDHSDLIGDYGGGIPAQSSIVYSRYTPVNTTGEFVLVHGDNSTSAWVYRVADGHRMTALKFDPSLPQIDSSTMGEVNELRWDYTGDHPYRLYFVGHSLSPSQVKAGEDPSMSFYSVDFDPVTGLQTTPHLIRDFSSAFPSATIGGTGVLMNDVEGDSSIDSRYWAWMVNVDTGSGSFRTYAVLVYDRVTDTIVSRLQRSCTGVNGTCVTINSPSAGNAKYMSRPNMVEMSPLATRVVVDWGRAYAGNRDAEIGTTLDGPKAFLKDFTDPIRIGSDETHSGWAWDAAGNELFVSQNNRNDYIEAVDIRTAATANCTLVSGGATNDFTCGTKTLAHADLGYLGMHFGKIYDRSKRGWLYMNTYSDGTPWAMDQNMLVKIKPIGPSSPATVVRLGSSYNRYYGDYRSEGSGALDFTGSSIWVTGNWGITDGRGDVFRTRLPSNLWTALP